MENKVGKKWKKWIKIQKLFFKKKKGKPFTSRERDLLGAILQIFLVTFFLKFLRKSRDGQKGGAISIQEVEATKDC